MKLKIVYCCLLILVILIFKNYALVLTTSLEAVNLWLTKVFPFLFIMFCLSDLLINLNFDQLFKTSTPFIVVSSFLSGAPSSAFVLTSLVNKKTITPDEANKYLLFTYFANPLFMYSILSTLFKPLVVFKLMFIHYLANFLIYLFLKKQLPTPTIKNKIAPYFNLGKSITKSMTSLTMILGTITFFMILTNIITHTLHLNLILTSLLKGFLEVTQGLNSLVNCPILPKIKEIIAISFLSFGGLSIHFQIKCFLDEYHLDYRYFLKGRIYQTLIAIGLTILT